MLFSLSRVLKRRGQPERAVFGGGDKSPNQSVAPWGARNLLPKGKGDAVFQTKVKTPPPLPPRRFCSRRKPRGESSEETSMTTTFVREVAIKYRGVRRGESFQPVKCPFGAAEFIRRVLPDNVREHFVVLFLDR